MLDFRSIETFLWVVKLGSFRGAAGLPDHNAVFNTFELLK